MNRFRQPLKADGKVYDNPIPTRFLAPIDCYKVQAQESSARCLSCSSFYIPTRAKFR
jgi:hypothetical protein